jgi:hypothetical protein
MDRRIHPSPARSLLLLSVVALVRTACGRDGGGEPGSEVAGAPLEVDRMPRLTLGVVHGDPVQEFDRVVHFFLATTSPVG